MRRHLSDENYNRFMAFKNRLNRDSTNIGYSANPVNPPGVLYAQIQPISHIIAGECPTLGPECKDFRDSILRQQNPGTGYPGTGYPVAGFLVLALILLIIFLVFYKKQ